MKSKLKATGATVITLIIAYIAAILFSWLRLPLPWMLGPLFFMAAASLIGVNVFGRPLGVTPKSRSIFIPIVGLMIGANVTPNIISEIVIWWPSLLLIVPYMLIAQLLNAAAFRFFGGYDRATAFFAASPGGFVEAVLIGEQHGGKTSLMAIQHFARVTLAVSVIPFLLSLQLGSPVGSAAGVELGAIDGNFSTLDFILMATAGFAGVYIAERLNLPAGIMVGPLLFSAILHATSITDAQVPGILVQIAQLVIGVTLGMQFAGPSGKEIAHALGLSLIALLNTLILAFGMSIIVSKLGMASAMVAFIAFAPGGLAEMGLIAISIDADPVFVAAHHVFRIGLAVILGPWLFKKVFLNRH